MTVIAFSDDDEGCELDARLPGLGHPAGRFDRTRFHEDRHGTGPGYHRGRRVARCLEGHRVYLKRNPHFVASSRDERDEHGFHWVHFPGEQDCDGHEPISPSEGQEHKILKARTVVAFRQAGNDPVRTEVSGSGRAYRSDVQFERPDGSRFALEIQVSGIDAVAAKRRTRLTRADGVEPLWLTSRAEEDWQQLVPCVRLIRPARGDPRPEPIERVAVFVTGIVEASWEPCEAGRACWRRRLHDTPTCPGHLRWRVTSDSAEQQVDETTSRYEDTARMLGIDTFAEQITRGEVVIVHAAREDRHGTFPVLSSPTARLAAFDYTRELEQWRARTRRPPRLGPATPFCTQPDRPEPDDTPTPQPAATPGSGPAVSLRARLNQAARALAISRHVPVRPVPDPAGFLRRHSTVGPGEILLVATRAGQDRLLDGGFGPGQIIVIDSASPARRDEVA